MMRTSRVLRAATLLSGFVFFVSMHLRPAAGKDKDEWLPITPEELALKEVPEAKGAHAVLLYRELFSDDTESSRTFYRRIKVFDDEGKKEADVEIPFLKDFSSVKDVRARTIRPDGSVVNWDGRIYEKTVVKQGGVKLLEKTFTLPEVQAGSLIEYKYKLQLDSNFYYKTYWEVQTELFTRRARFVIRPHKGSLGLMYRFFYLPKDAKLEKEKNGDFVYELHDIPAFQKEEFMPPERMLISRVEFYYTEVTGEVPDKFWKRVTKPYFEISEKFMNKKGAMAQEVAQVVSPSDPPETKLRKLYARAQKIQNRSFAEEKSEKEIKKESIKSNDDVEDVLKHGYGTGWDVNALFAALARAAGFQAEIVMAAPRDEVFFQPSILDSHQLSARLVWARADGKEIFLDPATKYCPYGLLPWEESGVLGFRLEKDGGVMITTPDVTSDKAVIERKADFELLADGTVQGKVQVTYSGQRALSKRLSSRNEDDTERRKDLESEFRGWLPEGASADLTSASGWEDTDAPLRAEFRVTMPNIGAATGRRILVPLGLSAAGKSNPFKHSDRTHPIYFAYPYREADEIQIAFPAGFEVESLPAPRQIGGGAAQYEISATQNARGIVVKRRLVMDRYLFEVKYYPALRAFFSEVAFGDEDKAVLKSSAARQ